MMSFYAVQNNSATIWTQQFELYYRGAGGERWQFRSISKWTDLICPFEADSQAAFQWIEDGFTGHLKVHQQEFTLIPSVALS